MDNTHFSLARQTMVDCQIRPTKVTDEAIIDAFATVPREAFVGRNQRAIAYVDEDLPLPGGRCMMEPMVMARMIRAMRDRPTENWFASSSPTERMRRFPRWSMSSV
mgnify:CR=1 FL=1